MRLRFAFLVPGLPFDGSTPGKTGLGGSESAALYLARALVKRGHEVTVFNNCQEASVHDGVTYLQAGYFSAYARCTPHDVTVVQRVPEPFQTRTNSKLNILWVHDLAAARASQVLVGSLWNIDTIATVSRFHTDNWREVYDLPEHLFMTSRNGVDLEAIADAGSDAPRDPKALLYAARPERGLDVLLDRIFPKILEQEPEATLHLAGYDNPTDRFAAFYDGINRRIAGFGDRVKWHGSLAKPDLYRLMKRCGVYAYPTPSPVLPTFREVSCILAMEAQACGLPIVTSNAGALPETIGEGAGALLDPEKQDYPFAFAEAVVDAMRKPMWSARMADAGLVHADALSWAGVAEQWENEVLSRIARLNDCPVRLARHFVRQSDIMAAEEVIRRTLRAREDTDPVVPQLKEIDARLSAHWSFRQDRDAYREQYEKIGVTHTDAFAGGSREGRLQVIGDWFEKRPELRNIVDVGCGLGIYAINLSNRLGPDRHITGIDIDHRTVAWAEKYRLAHAKHPEALEFITGDERTGTAAFGWYDAAICGEVMEHVPDPTAFLATIEAKVKAGGQVYVTVPFGPWEEISYDSYPHRAHLWHYEIQDLLDLLGAKPGLSIGAKPSTFSPMDGSPLGHFHVTWTVDHQPFGRIDMDRKLSFQRPRETLSACLIAGGEAAGDTLDWCIKSWRQLVDEIVVADTGITADVRARLVGYGARIIPALDPKIHGFETPRNTALANARGDWMLWIDLDERLLDPASLPKYLRKSVFDGFGIRQHHFAVDTTFEPDMPVRLLRLRNRNDGKTPRFYGMIHEHPETGLNEGPGRVIILSDANIAHVGYLHETGRQGRFWRNKPMMDADRAKYPERRLQKHFIMRDNILLVRYALNANGGVLTPELAALCEETIALYRDHFMGKPMMSSVNSLQYYSEALRMLGRGFDATFDLKVNRDGVGDPVIGGVRFDTPDDLVAEITGRAAIAVQAYRTANW